MVETLQAGRLGNKKILKENQELKKEEYAENVLGWEKTTKNGQDTWIDDYGNKYNQKRT